MRVAQLDAVLRFSRFAHKVSMSVTQIKVIYNS